MLFAVKTHFNQLPFQWKVSVDGDSYFFHTGDAWSGSDFMVENWCGRRRNLFLSLRQIGATTRRQNYDMKLDQECVVQNEAVGGKAISRDVLFWSQTWSLFGEIFGSENGLVSWREGIIGCSAKCRIKCWSLGRWLRRAPGVQGRQADTIHWKWLPIGAMKHFDKPK